MVGWLAGCPSYHAAIQTLIKHDPSPPPPQAKVASVEPDRPLAGGGSAGGGRVLLEGGAAVEYDWLVVALGAESDPRGVPGVRELARPFVSLEDAVYVKERLAALEAAAAAGGVRGGGGDGGALRRPAVVVVGAGYAGVELCSVIGERLRATGVAVRLVTPTADILPGAPEGQRDAALKALDGLGVELMARTKVNRLGPAAGSSAGGGGDGSSGSGGDGRCVVYLEGEGGAAEMEADLVVWTAGSAPVSKFAKVRGFRIFDHPAG